MFLLKVLLGACGVIMVLGLLWIRFAPIYKDSWHVTTRAERDKAFMGGVIRFLPAAGKAELSQLLAVIQQAPRTKYIAGGEKEGMVTYVTRTKVFGFPDFTTLWLSDTGLHIYARVRFGRIDFGVNRARVADWLSQAGLADNS
ncbi:MAG: DUF1499 domain-containing protein [Paracoccaceae bacterium]